MTKIDKAVILAAGRGTRMGGVFGAQSARLRHVEELRLPSAGRAAGAGPNCCGRQQRERYDDQQELLHLHPP